MRRESVIRLIVLVLTLILLGGCRGGSRSGNVQNDNSKTIGLLLPTVKIEFWSAIATGFEQKMNEAGHKVVLASYEGDAAKAVECVENYIVQKVDAIAGCMIDNSADDAFKRAMDAGIPIFAFGNDQTWYNYIMLTDNTDVGVKIAEMAADFANERHGGKCQIGAVISTTNKNMAERSEALLSTLAKLLPESEVVMSANMYDAAGEGMAFTENLLQKFPDVKVVCSYGDAMGIEAMEVFKAAGKTGDGIGIFACDATMQALLSIKNGDIFRGTITFGDVVQQLSGYMLSYFAGELPEGKYYAENTKITAANIDQFID
jgi:ABC-type sugar transport system substrate-binding protein